LLTIAFHKQSVSAWSSVEIWNENASLCLNAGPLLSPRQGIPSHGELYRQDITLLAVKIVAGCVHYGPHGAKWKGFSEKRAASMAVPLYHRQMVFLSISVHL